MVVILLYQLLKHQPCLRLLFSAESRYDGDLRPNEKALFVAKVIEFFVVLIVGKPYRVCADLLDYLYILGVLLERESVAEILSVLVAGYALELHMLAVEEEALVAVKIKLSQTEAVAHAVDDLAAPEHLRRQGVEVGRFHSLPEYRLGYIEPRLGLVGGHGDARNGAALGVGDCEALLAAVGAALGHALDIHSAVRLGGDVNSAKALIKQRKMRRRNVCDDIDVAVKSAVEGEIRHLRIEQLVRAVVHGQLEQIVALTQEFRYLEAEHRVAVDMPADKAAVDKYLADRVCARHLNEAPARALGQHPSVDALAPVVAVRTALTVDAVPGVRQINILGQPLSDKLPARIDIDNLTHSAPSFPFILVFFHHQIRYIRSPCPKFRRSVCARHMRGAEPCRSAAPRGRGRRICRKCARDRPIRAILYKKRCQNRP